MTTSNNNGAIVNQNGAEYDETLARYLANLGIDILTLRQHGETFGEGVTRRLANLGIDIRSIKKNGDIFDESLLRVLRTSSLGLTPTLRMVATNGRMPCNVNAAGRQMMCRSRHRATVNITSMKLAFANWYVSQTLQTEIAPGGACVYTAALEYPSGTNIGSFKLSGSSSMSCGDGLTIETDGLACSIPSGDYFFIRTFASTVASAVGLPYLGNTISSTRPAYNDSSNGEDTYYAASGITDTTTGIGALSGGTLNTATEGGPVAILGLSSQPAIYSLGDSKTVGIGDAYTGTSGDRGLYARSIGPNLAYSTIGCGGDGAVKFIADHARRLALKSYFTHVISNYAFNDLVNFSRTPAQLVADHQTIAGYFSGMPYFLSTLSPYSTSSNSLWDNTGTQTPQNTTNMNAASALFRAVPAGITGCFEVADVQATARDSNTWLFDATPRHNTVDGIHEATNGNLIVLAANAIPASAFVPY